MATIINKQISFSAIADNVVQAAVSGQKVKVVGYLISASGGANTVTWKTSATAISGPFDLAADEELGRQGTRLDPVMETVAGQGLNLALSAATAVTGEISYYLSEV